MIVLTLIAIDMKKNFSLIAFLLLAVVGAVATQACSSSLIEPSKKMQTKSYNYTGFDEIKASSAFEIQYQQSTDNTWHVEVTAPDNIMPYVVVKQHEDGISLSLKDGISSRKGYNLKAIIVAPSLEEINLSGASAFVTDKINSAELDIDLSGASSIDINTASIAEFDLELSGASQAKIANLKSTKAEIEATGASTVILAGTVHEVEMKASGASEIDAKALKADTGTLQASGASDINANIANVTHQNSSGASTIKNN